MLPTPPTLVGAALGSLALLVALPQTVAGSRKISGRFGNLPTVVNNDDQMGRSVAVLGDLDGDGVVDLATSGHSDDTGGPERGSVHVLFMNADGSVKAGHKITSVSGDLTGIDDGDQIGRALAAPGDLDLDGIPDLLVGANNDDDGGPDVGAVYVLYLRSNGTVRSEVKISAASGLGGVSSRDQFGRSLAVLGDLDGDGVPDLAVGAPYDDLGGSNVGALHILFLNRDGTVKGQSKIALGLGGFGGALDVGDMFGFSLAALGDVDGDGVPDLATGAVLDDDGGFNTGAVWVLLLRADGTVKASRKIGSRTGGFTDPLRGGIQFGFSVAAPGDIDGDGRPELVVGAPRDNDGGTARGALWVLSLNVDGSAFAQHKISQTSGGFDGRLRDWDAFGASLAALGDFNGDGTRDLVAGVRFDDDLGLNRGALYLVFLASAGAPPPPPDPVEDPPVDPPPPDPTLVAMALLSGRPGPSRYLVFSCGFPEGSQPTLVLRVPGEPDLLQVPATSVRNGRFVARLPADFGPPPVLEAQAQVGGTGGASSVIVLLPQS